MVRITKSESVLALIHADEDCVIFDSGAAEADRDGPYRNLEIDTESWAHMGNPDVITVVVVPGDLTDVKTA